MTDNQKTDVERSSVQPANVQRSDDDLFARRGVLFPDGTDIGAGENGDALTVAGVSLAELAERFGTPLYVYDQATMDAAVDSYRHALAQCYPGPAAITYAGKAFLNTAAAQWVQRRGLWLDCTGAGELQVAVHAQVAKSRILVHGVNKSRPDLDAAIQAAGVIVVDNLSELQRLVARQQQGASLPDLWLRVRPGVAVATHAYRQTGQPDSKFGLAPDEVLAAVRLCQQYGLALTGLHFHQGSHFHDPTPIGPAVETVLDLVAEVHAGTGWTPSIVSPGGGWGVAYHEDELPQPSIADYVAYVAQHLAAGCQQRGLPLPVLQVEPGRSLVARSGVAIYRIGTVKQTPTRRWLLIDGGMADNPRPALYGARYSALPVHWPSRPAQGTAWIAGPYCESGDVMIEELAMPALAEGELLAVPVSGAYHLAMGSNYNGARRPAVVWLADGHAHLVQRREMPGDLVARDLSLP